MHNDAEVVAMPGSSPKTLFPQLDRYEPIEEVGRGGMAIVYRARDRQLKREVAVKVLHAHLADDEPARERFRREAEAVAALQHDNILEIYDYSGTTAQEAFIVTELVRGTTLKQFLTQYGKAPVEIAALIVMEVCRGLAHAHEHGIVHRDIKPENVIVRQDGRVKLMDFGIAQCVEVTKLTATGQLIGSPAYMAPELILGHPTDRRADLYSTGVLLFQLVTGHLPFSGGNAHEVLKRIAEGRYLAPEQLNPQVDSHLSRLIERAMEREPAVRFQQATELLAALESFIKPAALGETRGELARYFGNPTGCTALLSQRVTEALLCAATEAITQRQQARAIGLLNRVLCLNPADARVHELLAQLHRGRRWLAAIAAAVVVVGLGILAASWWSNHPSKATLSFRSTRTAVGTTRPTLSPISALPAAQPAKGKVSALTNPPHAAALSGSAAVADAQVLHPVTERVSWSRRAYPARPVEHDEAGSPAPVVPHPQRIELIPVPKAVSVWLNGRLLGPYGPQLRFIEVPAGPARLVFRNDACCFEQTIELDATREALPAQLPVRLPWKPGRVVVTVTPPVAADVGVGTVVARAGQTIDVPIPSYVDTGQVEVEVAVSANGFRTESQTVTVRANSTTAVALRLRPLL